jgi:hypothetical protein
MENEGTTEREKAMSAAEVAVLLSQTMRDLADRKITLRQATAVSRIALALAKVIEVSDLNDRVEFIEQMLKKRK